jgi:transcriptional regulator with XRE-family HTH domain
MRSRVTSMGRIDYSGIGERIRRYRKEVGYTQRELADAIGGVQSTIASIEIGRTRGCLKTLDAIARSLGTTVDDLLHGDVERDLTNMPADNIPADIYEFMRNPESWKDIRALKSYLSIMRPTVKDGKDLLRNLV